MVLSFIILKSKNQKFIIITLLIFIINNTGNNNTIDIGYDQIADYRIEDNEHIRPNDSGMYVQYTLRMIKLVYSVTVFIFIFIFIFTYMTRIKIVCYLL